MTAFVFEYNIRHFLVQGANLYIIITMKDEGLPKLVDDAAKLNGKMLEPVNDLEASGAKFKAFLIESIKVCGTYKYKVIKGD